MGFFFLGVDSFLGIVFSFGSSILGGVEGTTLLSLVLGRALGVGVDSFLGIVFSSFGSLVGAALGIVVGGFVWVITGVFLGILGMGVLTGIICSLGGVGTDSAIGSGGGLVVFFFFTPRSSSVG